MRCLSAAGIAGSDAACSTGEETVCATTQLAMPGHSKVATDRTRTTSQALRQVVPVWIVPFAGARFFI
jgi:hypothetical protein